MHSLFYAVPIPFLYIAMLLSSPLEWQAILGWLGLYQRRPYSAWSCFNRIICGRCLLKLCSFFGKREKKRRRIPPPPLSLVSLSRCPTNTPFITALKSWKGCCKNPFLRTIERCTIKLIFFIILILLLIFFLSYSSLFPRLEDLAQNTIHRSRFQRLDQCSECWGQRWVQQCGFGLSGERTTIWDTCWTFQKICWKSIIE